MAAATQGRNTVQSGAGQPIPQSIVRPVKASTIIYQGTLVAIDSTGYCIPATATSTLKVVGVAAGPGNTGTNGDVDNSTGANGAKTVRIMQGAFWFANNGSSIANTDAGKLCYAVTDQDVDLSSSGGTRPVAGIILGVDSTLGVLVLVGVQTQQSANATLPSFYVEAKAVATAALAAYTRVAGVITANANGALGSVFDGVTIAAGDTVFLPEGIAAAATDAGPYVVTQLGTAGLPFILTRPSWYTDGSLIPMGFEVRIGTLGTLWKGSVWKSFVTTATKVVGTDAPLFWPAEAIQQVTLVAGTATISNVPIRSATDTHVTLTRTVANTSTLTTGGYAPTVAGANGRTAGALGTGSVVIQACVAAGTINNADVSTLTVMIKNW